MDKESCVNCIHILVCWLYREMPIPNAETAETLCLFCRHYEIFGLNRNAFLHRGHNAQPEGIGSRVRQGRSPRPSPRATRVYDGGWTS